MLSKAFWKMFQINFFIEHFKVLNHLAKGLLKNSCSEKIRDFQQKSSWQSLLEVKPVTLPKCGLDSFSCFPRIRRDHFKMSTV